MLLLNSGKYFLVQGKSVTPKVNLEELVRELGCIQPRETVEREWWFGLN
jgi:hypothetical protein